MNIVTGIDLGTQSLKVILYDVEEKNVVAKTSASLDLLSDQDGTREQKTQWYDEALKICFSQLPQNLLKKVIAVGVSGQQHGFVPLDKNGNSLYNVKLWNDTSTTEECHFLTEAAGSEDAVIQEVGNLMLPGFTAPKILWLKRNKPAEWQKLRYILLPHDYINFILTDNYCMEYGDASGTALFNPKTRSWSKTMCDFIDSSLYDILPPLIESHKKAGIISEKAASLFGLPAGIPVSSGGGDNMMGAIGTGTVSDGFLTMSLGTSGTLYGYSNTPLTDPKNGLSGFCSSTGGWLPLLCTMNCTVAQEQIRELFNLSVAEFDNLANESVAGANGVIVLPFFNGERTPNLPNGKASITGLTVANTERRHICRAAMESAVFAIRAGLEAFRALGFSPKEIRLIGGGAKSALWRRIASDILNVPIKIPL
ncbi:MAG: xylulokinase, partial [Spirochaetales bacterium]